LRTYKWKVDKNGKPLDEPVKFNDDGMDAMRYGIYNGLKQANKKVTWF
jgi:phage terminase large subunit